MFNRSWRIQRILSHGWGWKKLCPHARKPERKKTATQITVIQAVEIYIKKERQDILQVQKVEFWCPKLFPKFSFLLVLYYVIGWRKVKFAVVHCLYMYNFKKNSRNWNNIKNDPPSTLWNVWLQLCHWLLTLKWVILW